MAGFWRTFVIDRTGYAPRFQNVSKFVDKRRSKFRDSSRSDLKGGGTMFLVFRHDQTLVPGLKIDDEMEVWRYKQQGGVIVEVEFGGYIHGHRNTTYGWEHEVECNLVTYTYDLETTELIGWPFDPRHTPVDGISGFPPGYPVAAWLGHGGPYPGLIPYHFDDRVDVGGIDPYFHELIFTEQARPTKSAVYGYMTSINLAAGLQEIADCAQFYNPNMQPAFFMRAVVDENGTGLRPQLCFVDLNSPDAASSNFKTFADMPDTGEFGMIEFFHERDPDGTRQRVTVIGAGGDPDTGEWICATALNEEHFRQYPTVYQRDFCKGRAGAPIIKDSINRQFIAQAYAEVLEYTVWGPKGRVGFKTTERIVIGDFVWVRHTIQDINRLYPVQDVKYEFPYYTAIVGMRQKDINDIINGPTLDILLIRASTNAPASPVTDWANLPLLPQAPPLAPIVDQPSAVAQNTVQSLLDTVPGLTINVAQNVRLMTITDIKIDPAAVDAPESAGILLPAVPPVNPNVRLPDSAGLLNQWADQENGSHPHTEKIPFFKNGTMRVPVAENWVRYVQAIVRPPQDVTLTYAKSVDGILRGVDPPTLENPLSADFGDWIDITLAGAVGISANNPLVVMLTEKPQTAKGGLPVVS